MRFKYFDGGPVDPHARVLRRGASNYVGTDEPIELRWQDGLFVAEPRQTGILAHIERGVAEKVFVEMLDRL